MENIIFEKTALVDFVRQNAKAFTLEWENPFKSNAYFDDYKLNGIIKTDFNQPKLYDEPLSNIYSYEQGEKIALFFTLNINKRVLNQLIDKLGYPESYTAADIYDPKNYIFLWPGEGLEVTVSKREFGSSPASWSMTITNIPYKELIRDELRF